MNRRMFAARRSTVPAIERVDIVVSADALGTTKSVTRRGVRSSSIDIERSGLAGVSRGARTG